MPVMICAANSNTKRSFERLSSVQAAVHKSLANPADGKHFHAWRCSQHYTNTTLHEQKGQTSRPRVQKDAAHKDTDQQHANT